MDSNLGINHYSR